MHIGLIHDSIIPPKTYGGIPRVLANLAQGLLAAGHRVTLLSLPGSHIDGAEFIDISGLQIYQPGVKEILPPDLDILHWQANPRFVPDFPYIVTIHGNCYTEPAFLPNTAFLSESHRKNHNAACYVYNGIDLPEAHSFGQGPPPWQHKEDYFVFLAKASWSVKNLKAAKNLVRDKKTFLKVCGGKGLSTKRIQYMGMVDEQAKRAILPKARALLFPVNWHEPFGIAVLEAMAMGTPVIASANGALPELIEHGRTGFICHSYAEFLEAMDRVDEIDPEECRRRVRDKFSIEQMTRGYLELYNQILQGRELGPLATDNQNKQVNKIYKPRPTKGVFNWLTR